MDNLPQKFQNLVHGIQEHSQMTPELLKSLVEAQNIEEGDLLPFACFDHDQALSYGRRTLFANQRFGVHVMSWIPGDFTALHGHGHAHWALLMFFGPCTHRVYEVEGENITLKGKQTIPSGTALTPPIAEFYHAMGNLSPRPFQTLHIYGCDTYSGPTTEDSLIYQLEKNQVLISKGPAFLDMPPEAVKGVLDHGIKCDSQTRADYYHCVEPFFKRIGRAGELVQ